MPRINRRKKKNGLRAKTKTGYKMVAYCPFDVGQNQGHPAEDPHVVLAAGTRKCVCPANPEHIFFVR